MDAASHQLYRVCLNRALSTHYQSGSAYRISAQLLSEFRDESAVNSVLSHCKFRFFLESTSSGERVHILAKPVKISKNCYLYNLIFPDVIGPFQLAITAESDDSSLLMIPMKSDVFELVSSLPVDRGMLLAAYWTYGILDCDPPTQLVLREEFGSTLGSHVWDSAVVFTRHLKYCLDLCQFSKRETAVELGAGCGLAGIAVGQYFDSVALTDKACNMPFMRNNISINHCEDTVRAYTLDWSSDLDISAFTEAHGKDIDLIVAADVLYDIPAANLLFSLLRLLSTPQRTCILLGQKLRPFKDHAARFDVTALPDFDAEKIVEEANVILWKITYKKLKS